MSAIKRFFEKRKLDVKFKTAGYGTGHKLTEDTRQKYDKFLDFLNNLSLKMHCFVLELLPHRNLQALAILLHQRRLNMLELQRLTVFVCSTCKQE